MYKSYKLYRRWFLFFFKQKTAYEMRISDWSSDVCSSDLLIGRKVLQDGGQKLGKFGKLVQDFIKANADKPEMKEFIEPLMDIGDKVTKLTAEQIGRASCRERVCKYV